MRIGYPCINTTIGCTSSRTFRLKSYSERRLLETVKHNLDCLAKTLTFNATHGILFFRITSDLVPFASHPICTVNWPRHFSGQFQAIGDLVENHGMRVSMHPDPFTLINSLDTQVFENSVRELQYHAQVLDLMNLGASAKIQIHVGGVYGNKAKSMTRFADRFASLDRAVQRRLVVENDDSRYDLRDCLEVSARTHVPVLFDVFHHEVNCSGEPLEEAFRLFTQTWTERDGAPMVDYSTQEPGRKQGTHGATIDLHRFAAFLERSKPHDFDLMLEIKDKELSALKALGIASQDERFAAAQKHAA
jgi:UV DNA damage endonuclease